MIVATYSIAACDLHAGQWGVATQSKFLAVGSVVPWAEPQVGAIATQALANPRYGPEGLALLRQGLSAQDVVDRLTAADDDRDHRQLGVVDANGGSATYTGSACMAWAGGLSGPGFAAQGNILVGEETVAALATTFTATEGRPLAERLAALGYDGDLESAFRAWSGTENLEERVDGVAAIDPVVLAELRSRA